MKRTLTRDPPEKSAIQGYPIPSGPHDVVFVCSPGFCRVVDGEDGRLQRRPGPILDSDLMSQDRLNSGFRALFITASLFLYSMEGFPGTLSTIYTLKGSRPQLRWSRVGRRTSVRRWETKYGPAAGVKGFIHRLKCISHLVRAWLLKSPFPLLVHLFFFFLLDYLHNILVTLFPKKNWSNQP